MTPRHAVVRQKLQVDTAFSYSAITIGTVIGERAAAIQMAKASVGGTARSLQSQRTAILVELARWFRDSTIAAIE